MKGEGPIVTPTELCAIVCSLEDLYSFYAHDWLSA